MYSQYVPTPAQRNMYSEVAPPQIAISQNSFPQQPLFPASTAQPLPSADSGVFVEQDQSTAENLSEALGELKIDETGIGKSFYNQSPDLVLV